MCRYGVHHSRYKIGLILEEFDNLLEVSQAHTMLRIADVDLLSESAKLVAEISLAAETKILDNRAICAGKELSTNATKMLTRRQRLGYSYAKGDPDPRHWRERS